MKITEENIVNDSKTEYEKALKCANDGYLFTVILTAVLIVIGIAVAVLYRVSIGLCIGIASVLVYMGLTKNILYKTLGIYYRSGSGALTVTELYGKGRTEVFVPEKLLWMPVREIDSLAFKHESSASIQTLHLPCSLSVIGKDILEGCDSLCTVYFEGSEAEFAEIESATDFSAYTLVFAKSSTVSEQTESEADA